MIIHWPKKQEPLDLEKDFCKVLGSCKECGQDVREYCCNDPMMAIRPESEDWDWWAFCVNEKCEHHYGEGISQNTLKWVDYK